MKPEYIELFDKITEGVKWAFTQLLEERAAQNSTVIIGNSDGTIMHVPAREILEKRMLGKA